MLLDEKKYIESSIVQEMRRVKFTGCNNISYKCGSNLEMHERSSSNQELNVFFFFPFW